MQNCLMPRLRIDAARHLARIDKRASIGEKHSSARSFFDCKNVLQHDVSKLIRNCACTVQSCRDDAHIYAHAFHSCLAMVAPRWRSVSTDCI
jgi:hypothetical protein